MHHCPTLPPSQGCSWKRSSTWRLRSWYIWSCSSTFYLTQKHQHLLNHLGRHGRKNCNPCLICHLWLSLLLNLNLKLFLNIILGQGRGRLPGLSRHPRSSPGGYGLPLPLPILLPFLCCVLLLFSPLMELLPLHSYVECQPYVDIRAKEVRYQFGSSDTNLNQVITRRKKEENFPTVLQPLEEKHKHFHIALQDFIRLVLIR